MENQINQIGQTQKAIKNINLIKAPIIELANILGNQRVHGREENTKQRKGSPFSPKGLIPLVNLGILLLVLIVVILLMFKVSPNGNKSNDTFESLQDSISILKEENEELKNQLPSTEGNDETKDIVQETFSTGRTTPNTPNEVSIDVNNYNERKAKFLQLGTHYSATVKNPSTNEGCKWSIKGGHIVGADNGTKVTFVPESDQVTLSYQNKDGESVSRSLIITSN